MANGQPRWDAFVSHASEDKAFVRLLVGHLNRLGARTWYDEFELTPGDSLIASIDRGLAESRYGLLVLTPAFLGRPWTEYERRGLASRHVHEGRVVVIPIWLGVDHAEVARLSPTLADQFAIVAGTDASLEVAVKALAVIRPDQAQAYVRRLQLDALIGDAADVLLTRDRVTPREPPMRYEKLPRSLLTRISVVHQVFADVMELSWEQTVRNFQGDLRPDREIAIWEAMAAVYLEVSRSMPAVPKRDIFRAVLERSANATDGLGETDEGRAVLDAYRRLEEGTRRLESDDDQPFYGPLTVEPNFERQLRRGVPRSPERSLNALSLDEPARFDGGREGRDDVLVGRDAPRRWRDSVSTPTVPSAPAGPTPAAYAVLSARSGA